MVLVILSPPDLYLTMCSSSIGVGFSTKEVPLSRPPGWEPNSWAYHGDDGRSFCCQSSGKDYGPTFTTNDVIGCGFNFHTSSAFFTKNGNPLGKNHSYVLPFFSILSSFNPVDVASMAVSSGFPIDINAGTAFREVRGKLFPSVGMKRPGEHVWVNFGQSPFVFDIDGMVLVSQYTQFLQLQLSKWLLPFAHPYLASRLMRQWLSLDTRVRRKNLSCRLKRQGLKPVVYAVLFQAELDIVLRSLLHR